MTTIRRAGTTSAAVLSGLALTLGVAQAAAPRDRVLQHHRRQLVGLERRRGRDGHRRR